jgi:hypothetical protein
MGIEVVASNPAINQAKFYSRSQDALIRVYDAAGNVIKTHEHAGYFKEPWIVSPGQICSEPSWHAKMKSQLILPPQRRIRQLGTNERQSADNACQNHVAATLSAGVLM